MSNCCSSYNLSPLANKSACALNNVACEMMVRGQFEAAVNTLNEAIQIMFRGAGDLVAQRPRPGSEEHHRSYIAPAQHDDILLSAAYCRLSKMTDMPRLSLPFLRLSTVESNDLQSLKAAGELLSYDSSCFTTVLIREQQQHDSNKTNRFQAERGIVLYNFGLACHLHSVFPNDDTVGSVARNGVAAVRQHQDHKTVFKNRAVRSLLLSHATFSSILSRCSNAGEDLECWLLAILVLSTAAKVFHWHNELFSAQEVVGAVNTLLSAAQGKLLEHLMPNESASAAAA